MIFLLLFTLIILIPVSTILISRTVRKKNEIGKPTYKSISTSSQINNTYYIYSRGSDISLQTTLSCLDGMKLVNSDGLYNIVCGDDKYMTYNDSDGTIDLSINLDTNSYFKIFKSDDYYIISNFSEEKFLMFSEDSKKFYMVEPNKATLEMLDTIYVKLEINKRDGDISQ